MRFLSILVIFLPVLTLSTLNSSCSSIQLGSRIKSNSDTDLAAPVLPVRDVSLGMNRSAVRQAWGDPVKVFVAGNQASQIEKWVYPEDSVGGLSSSARRVLYFENGSVVGWETQP